MEQKRRKGILTDMECGACKQSLDGGPTPGGPFYAEGSRFSRRVGVEYWYTSPYRRDGVSEYQCPNCQYRQGRTSGLELFVGEVEDQEGYVVVDRWS